MYNKDHYYMLFIFQDDYNCDVSIYVKIILYISFWTVN